MNIIGVRHTNDNRVFMDRLFWPLSQAPKHGDSLLWTKNPVQAMSVLSGADVLCMTRVADAESLLLIEKAKRAGVKVVVDVDDAIHSIPHHNPYYVIWGTNRDIIRQWIAIYRDVKEPTMAWCYRDYTEEQVVQMARGRLVAVEEALRNADLVTTSTGALAKFYSDLLKLKHVVILPNQISEQEWDGVQKKPGEAGRVNIRWGGSDTHHDDLEIIRRPMQQVMEACPELDFEVMGLDGYGRSMFAHLPQDRFLSHKSIPHSEYMGWLSYADIIIAPSDNSTFTKCKSDIRVLQAGWMGIPVVASPSTYGKTVTEAKMGHIAQDDGRWVTCITSLVKDAEERKRLGENGRAYTAGLRTYEKTYCRWQETYRELTRHPAFAVPGKVPA